MRDERSRLERAERFEDLLVWQKAREWVRQIYLLTENGRFSRDFGLRDQIRRAAVSVLSNVAEGFERGGRPDFARFVAIAKASCAEVRAQLYVAHDIQYLTREDFENLMGRAEEIGRLLGGLRVSLLRTP